MSNPSAHDPPGPVATATDLPPGTPRLAAFDHIVFFTGAGMSAQSGVPTYRGAGGIWKEYDYTRYACQEAFDRDPAGVWDFHDYRRTLVAPCQPHDGHRVIVEAALERADDPQRSVTVVTQNIDGMHQLAGSGGVLELHGSLWGLRCTACGARHHTREAPLANHHCHDCGAWWRPAIVWFGDHLDPSTVERATAAIARCDLLVSVGTSAVVYPAAALPRIAAANGAVCVEINPEATPMSALYQHHLRGSASAMLRAMHREANTP